MAERLGILMNLEMRPIPPGTWIYEQTRATYRGYVEITIRYPDMVATIPSAHVPPVRVVIPMVYTMHIPPAYGP